jgi:hypothetical protein
MRGAAIEREKLESRISKLEARSSKLPSGISSIAWQMASLAIALGNEGLETEIGLAGTRTRNQRRKKGNS